MASRSPFALKWWAMMTTSANHAGTDGRLREEVWTSIQGLGIIGRETSDLERMFCFLLIRALSLPFTLAICCQLVAHPVGSAIPMRPYAPVYRNGLTDGYKSESTCCTRESCACPSARTWALLAERKSFHP